MSIRYPSRGRTTLPIVLGEMTEIAANSADLGAPLIDPERPQVPQELHPSLRPPEPTNLQHRDSGFDAAPLRHRCLRRAGPARVRLGRPHLPPESTLVLDAFDGIAEIIDTLETDPASKRRDTIDRQDSIERSFDLGFTFKATRKRVSPAAGNSPMNTVLIIVALLLVGSAIWGWRGRRQ